MPIKRTHREIVVLVLPNGKLLFEVIKGVELVASIELLVVFSVAAFHLAVVPGRKRFDLFVADAELRQCFLEEGKRLCVVPTHAVGKFKPIVCLDTFDGIRELFNHMQKKLCRRIGAVLLKRL